MSDRDGFIWYDGKLVPWRDATTHVLTHTLHYGMGVFEGLRAYRAAKGTAIFRLQEHTDRLFQFRSHLPDEDAVRQSDHHGGALEVVRANKLESCYIRRSAFMARKRWVSPPKTLCTTSNRSLAMWERIWRPMAWKKASRVKIPVHRHHVT